jgi:hypothetical protein
VVEFDMKKPVVVKLSGMPGAGKTTMVKDLEAALTGRKYKVLAVVDSIVPPSNPGSSDDFPIALKQKEVMDSYVSSLMCAHLKCMEEGDIDIVLVDHDELEVCAWNEYLKIAGQLPENGDNFLQSHFIAVRGLCFSRVRELRFHLDVQPETALVRIHMRNRKNGETVTLKKEMLVGLKREMNTYVYSDMAESLKYDTPKESFNTYYRVLERILEALEK